MDTKSSKGQFNWDQTEHAGNTNQCTVIKTPLTHLPLSLSLSSFFTSCFSGGFCNLLGPISHWSPNVEFHHWLDQLPTGNLPVCARHLWSVFLPQLSSQPHPLQPHVHTFQRNFQGGHVPSATSHRSQETLAQCHSGDAPQHPKWCAARQRSCCRWSRGRRWRNEDKRWDQFYMLEKKA